MSFQLQFSQKFGCSDSVRNADSAYFSWADQYNNDDDDDDDDEIVEGRVLYCNRGAK